MTTTTKNIPKPKLMATPPPHGNPRNLNPETHGHHHHHGNPPPSPPWTHKKIHPKIKSNLANFESKRWPTKKNQVKIYTNPATNQSRSCKPHRKPMNIPLQTTIPRRCIPMNPENVPKKTQKSPPYHADLTSQSHLHAGPTTHARIAHREREMWWERDVVVERGMGRETKWERESENGE